MKHLRPSKLLLTLGITGITLVCCYPFIWMVFACFKSNAEIFPCCPPVGAPKRLLSSPTTHGLIRGGHWRIAAGSLLPKVLWQLSAGPD